MARLVLPQFEQVSAAGTEIDRSLDLEDIDAAFGTVAKVLNEGLGPGNFAATMRLANGVAANAIPNAWREGASQVTFFAQGVNQNTVGLYDPVWNFVLANVPSVGTWIPLRLFIIASYSPVNVGDPAGPPIVTVQTPGYGMVLQAKMKPVGGSVAEKKYGSVSGQPNTTPKVSYSTVKTAAIYKLDLVSAEQSLAPTGADGHLLGGYYPDGTTFGLPNGKAIKVAFDRGVVTPSASLTCLTPHTT